MHISQKEWRAVIAFALGVVLLTSLPYAVGWGAAGADWEFNGFVFGVEDGNAYLGKMKLGVEGSWRFYLFYSPEETPSAFGLYLPHLALGQGVRLFGPPPAAELPTVLALVFRGGGWLQRCCWSWRLTSLLPGLWKARQREGWR
ncbi:MAG: hypothetical protein HC915_08695 [Anaerolineae bacterium]|nr:hypothetical protein [Anaerolineae bacterium]